MGVGGEEGRDQGEEEVRLEPERSISLLRKVDWAEDKRRETGRLGKDRDGDKWPKGSEREKATEKSARRGKSSRPPDLSLHRR